MFDEFINWMASHKAGDTRLVRFATGQVWVARHLERVGDHITNIAERVYFVVKGETLKNMTIKLPQRRKGEILL